MINIYPSLYRIGASSCGALTIKDFNTVTKKNDAVRRCSSEGFECEKISIEKLKHFVSKDALNIEGLGKQLYPALDFWSIANPFLKNWISEVMIKYPPIKL